MSAFQAIIKRAFYVSIGVTLLALWLSDSWIHDTCHANPLRPDASHTNLVFWIGARAGNTRCFVSAADAQHYRWLTFAFCAAAGLTLALGLLRQRLQTTSR
jgi:hypothetical protein